MLILMVFLYVPVKYYFGETGRGSFPDVLTTLCVDSVIVIR